MELGGRGPVHFRMAYFNTAQVLVGQGSGTLSPANWPWAAWGRPRGSTAISPSIPVVTSSLSQLAPSASRLAYLRTLDSPATVE